MFYDIYDMDVIMSHIHVTTDMHMWCSGQKVIFQEERKTENSLVLVLWFISKCLNGLNLILNFNMFDQFAFDLGLTDLSQRINKYPCATLWLSSHSRQA